MSNAQILTNRDYSDAMLSQDVWLFSMMKPKKRFSSVSLKFNAVTIEMVKTPWPGLLFWEQFFYRSRCPKDPKNVSKLVLKRVNGNPSDLLV